MTLAALGTLLLLPTACSSKESPASASASSTGAGTAEGGGGTGGQGGVFGGQGGLAAAGGAGGQSPAGPCTQAPTVTLNGMPVSAVADFGSVPAHGDARSIEVAFTNHCDDKLLFLGHPSDWLSGSGFSISSLPPVAIAGKEQGSFVMSYEPADEGVVRGALQLPYDQPGSPLALSLAATVTAPRRLVFVGDGGHRMTSLDYAASFALDTFTTMQAHGDSLQRGVCAGNGRFVAVGGNVDRRWWTSDDGLSWTAHQGAGSPLGSCAYGNGWFVAFDGGGPQRSSDGTVWTSNTAPFNQYHLRSIVFAGDRYVASGDSGRVAVSLDGTQWDQDQVLNIGDLRSVCYGNGVVVAAGAAGWVASSSDGGMTWQSQQVGQAAHGGCAFGRGAFYVGAGGSIYRSVDGAVWQYVNASAAVPKGAFGRYLFGTSGNNIFRSEDDAFSWTLVYASPGGLPVNHAVLEAPQ